MGLQGVGVVNSKVSIPHSYPYMVYIHDQQTREACAGFLIREDFVMTAAHCKTNHLMVYLGVNDTNDLPEGIEVDAFPHPDYANKLGDDDIMLLKLKTPVTPLHETVNIIALPETNKEEISSNCMFMGWGEYNEKTPSSVLREVNVTLLDSEICATPHTLCTQEEIKPAWGRGGPLICGNVTQGIASYYIPSGSRRYLSMYTKISHYLPWIHEMLNRGLHGVNSDVWSAMSSRTRHKMNLPQLNPATVSGSAAAPVYVLLPIEVHPVPSWLLDQERSALFAELWRAFVSPDPVFCEVAP
ncbi:chymase-like [Misgurnus anguillicaudatus]|uniref:chymase-like n=1 Tax=Misgurnus anguillicaudatus TaxID=75329 RepID=UPI003CCF26CC